MSLIERQAGRIRYYLTQCGEVVINKRLTGEASAEDWALFVRQAGTLAAEAEK